MTDAVAVINAGSSSVKFSIYSVDERDLHLIAKGQVEGIGAAPRFIAKNAHGEILAQEHLGAEGDSPDHSGAFDHLRVWVEENLDVSGFLAVGHRVVHGGPHYDAPVLVNDEVLSTLDSLIPLAPLHQPHNLATIRSIANLAGALPQVACFDTAFHRGHDSVVERFGLPEEFYRDGIRRYGFHGLSYEYIAQVLPEAAPEIAGGRVVVAHLGAGASMCAMHKGCSVDSTMGFTAVDGLPMGTRSGSLDPGAIIYLIREKGMGVDAVESLLYERSGLLGISGISKDMRHLEESDSELARAAIDYFVYRIGRELGSLAAAIGGLDGLVFTAGIGENSPTVRAKVCEQARWLGVELDEEANATGKSCISRRGSSPSVWVIPTDEELMIARHTLRLVR